MQLVWNPRKAEERGELRVSQSPLLSGTCLLIIKLNKCGHCGEFPGEYKRVRGCCWLQINTNNTKELIHRSVLHGAGMPGSTEGSHSRGHMLSHPCPQQRSLHCSIRAEIPRAAPSGHRHRPEAERDKAGSLRTPERSFYSAWRWDSGQDPSWGTGKPGVCVGNGLPSEDACFQNYLVFFFYIQSPETKHPIRAHGLEMTLETIKLLLNMGEQRGKPVKIVHKQQVGSFLCSQTSGTCLFIFAQTHFT